MNKLQQLLYNQKTLTCNVDCISSEFRSILFGDTIQSPTYNIEYTVMKQVREHRKNRINKKWAKRYGFIPIKRTIKNLKVINDIDNSITLSGYGEFS